MPENAPKTPSERRTDPPRVKTPGRHRAPVYGPNTQSRVRIRQTPAGWVGTCAPGCPAQYADTADTLADAADLGALHVEIWHRPQTPDGANPFGCE